MVGIIDSLTTGQQLELIYVGYFGRSADNAGFTFWEGQNALAQANGQSASIALSNIANAFAPQRETIALYPFLGSDPTQIDIGTLVDGVSGNLFGRSLDPDGKAYWVGQLARGEVAIGSAILAISNGALGADAIAINNKIAVALDFTTRESVVERTASPGALFTAGILAAAHNVLNGVDGLAPSDVSVLAGMNATTIFLETPTQFNSLRIIETAPTETELASINQLVHPYILQFTGDRAIVDASLISATTYLDCLGTGDVAVTNLSNTQHVADFSGSGFPPGQYTISGAVGNHTLNLDLAFTDAHLGGSTHNTPLPYHGIGLSGLTQINITSNGPGANVIAGFFDLGPGGALDNAHDTITGSADLALGTEPPFEAFQAHAVTPPKDAFPAFPGVIAGGVTIDASRFLGSLIYTSSGKGDTITGGFGNDVYYSAANDKINLGSGADMVLVHQGKFISPTGADIVTIAGFNAATDQIAIVVENVPVPSVLTFSDLTSLNLSNAANAVTAAQAAFILNAGRGTPEHAGDIVAFSFGGDTYDAVSLDGHFGANGYAAPGTGVPAEMLVKLTGAVTAQTAHDFFFTDFPSVF